ncbi:MAG TPA: alpha/beta hydrolase [Polyangiaceae bacterium]|nr:alpha/beta hydrolase [Polyangiaceae bacterium]
MHDANSNDIVTRDLHPIARPPRRIAPFVTADDGETLFCRDVGAGAPVVLVHGWGLSSQMWQHQTGPLVDAGHRCITYDRRGHGRSSPAAAGYDYDTLTDDLEAVMAHHDLQGVTLVGHSMGCAEIVRYFARHGSRRVARVALIAPLTPLVLRTPDNPDGVPLEMFQRQWASWRTDFAAWVEANRQPFFTSETSPAMMSWAVGLLLATHLDVALATSRVSVTADLRPDLAAIDRPVLVIHGNRDASVPLELGRRTAAAIKGARLSVYDGAPHGLFLSHSGRLNEELIAFGRS